MSDSNITRRGFLVKAAAIAAIPVIASAISSCGDGGEGGVTPPENSFDAELNAKETITVDHNYKISGQENLARLPKTAFYAPALEYDIYLVLRKIRSEGRTYMQFIQVNAVDSSKTLVTVEGLPSGAVLYMNPRALIGDLAKSNHMETKKRFKRIELYAGGSL